MSSTINTIISYSMSISFISIICLSWISINIIISISPGCSVISFFVFKGCFRSLWNI
nr:MAG TPA: hypothetical protein [Crassvirales sp.]DAO31076.1 MAG TPA: hypothetical protein [Crassvirales sp.]